MKDFDHLLGNSYWRELPDRVDRVFRTLFVPVKNREFLSAYNDGLLIDNLDLVWRLTINSHARPDRLDIRKKMILTRDEVLSYCEQNLETIKCVLIWGMLLRPFVSGGSQNLLDVKPLGDRLDKIQDLEIIAQICTEFGVAIRNHSDLEYQVFLQEASPGEVRVKRLELLGRIFKRVESII